jgi:hypothetical protein
MPRDDSYGINCEGVINAMDLNRDGSRVVVAGRNGMFISLHVTFVIFTLMSKKSCITGQKMLLHIQKKYIFGSLSDFHSA